VRALEEELKRARREGAEAVGQLRRENAALRQKCARLGRAAHAVAAREGSRGAEKDALKAALDAKEHR